MKPAPGAGFTKPPLSKGLLKSQEFPLLSGKLSFTKPPLESMGLSFQGITLKFLGNSRGTLDL